MPVIFATNPITASVTSGGNAFGIIQPDSGTSPTATTTTDTLTVTSGSPGLSVSGNSATNTLTFTVNGQSLSHGFTTGAVAFGAANGTLTYDSANFIYDNTNKFLALGTTAPATTLEVITASTLGFHLGKAKLKGGYINCDGDEALYMTGGAQYSTFTSDYVFTARNGVGTTACGLIYEGGVIYFWTFSGTSTGNSSLINERLTILNNGNIGMGTTNPTQPLDVVGIVRFRHFSVAGAVTTDATGVLSSATDLNLANTSGYLLTVGQTRLGSQFDSTVNAVASISALTVNVVNGQSYRFEADLFMLADATGGVRVTISGTATVSLIRWQTSIIDNGSDAFVANKSSTALASETTAVGPTDLTCFIDGLLTCNGSGTIGIYFSQKVANGTSSVYAGSNFVLEKIL